ncbi:MAG: hypothetical protein PUD40_01260, partial [Bacteroidales bacterium]|nr:hypothetical protein [Bacteroidales bacterium]
LSLLRRNVFFVYRLVLDAKPDRGMLQPAENTRACSRDFQPATASMARKRHCIQRKGFSRFLSILLAQHKGVIPFLSFLQKRTRRYFPVSHFLCRNKLLADSNI